MTTLARNKNRRLRARRLARQGLTLVEIMVVIVIIGLVAGAAGFAVLNSLEKAKIKTTGNDCTTLAGAVTMWKAQNGSSDCPDMDTLVSDGQLTAAKTDAWGNAFAIECDGLTITVTSPGPDEQMGTEDDIR